MKKNFFLFLLFISSFAFAMPNGFDTLYKEKVATKRTHEAQTERSLSEVIRYANDDEIVTVRGRLTKQFNNELFEFTYENDRVSVEFNSDRSWDHISKDQLILITGEVDRGDNGITIDVKQAVALSR